MTAERRSLGLFARVLSLLLLLLLGSWVISAVYFNRDRAQFFAEVFVQSHLADLKLAVTAARQGQPLPAAAVQRGWRLQSAAEAEAASLVRLPSQFLVEAAALLQTRLAGEAELGDLQYQRSPSQALWLRVTSHTHLRIPYSGNEPVYSQRFWSAVLLTIALLMVSAWLLARWLTRPLHELALAAKAVQRHEPLPALRSRGPREVVELNCSFLQMAQALALAARQRSVMLAGISHDLRSPLARIRMAAELPDVSERIRQRLVCDVESADRILGQFIDFARASAAEPARRPKADWADLAEVAARVVSQRGTERVCLQVPSAARVALEPTLAERLVANLVDNALLHGAPPVMLTVNVDTSIAPHRVRLVVHDAGPGVPPSEAARLLEPFERLDSARGGPAGSGLGLAIVARIAELGGGTLSLGVGPEGGLAVTVLLQEAQGAPLD